MTPTVPAALRRALGVQVTRDLGGRLNRHWLVTRGGRPLVLRRWAGTWAEVTYERDLRARVAALGWPAARDVSEVVEADGALWSLAEELPGEPQESSAQELRTRGRLLAEFHESTRTLEVAPRPGWRSAADTLADLALDRAFEALPDPAEARLLLWHLHQAREQLAGVDTAGRRTQLVHGDFTAWNLLYRGGRLSGLLDFELSRPDWRVADFALAWRGEHDAVLRAYAELTPLPDAEWALVTPTWWALLLEGAFRDTLAGRRDDGWTARMLRRRSALLPAPPFPGRPA